MNTKLFCQSQHYGFLNRGFVRSMYETKERSTKRRLDHEDLHSLSLSKQPCYTVVNGVRKVKPYFFKYEAVVCNTDTEVVGSSIRKFILKKDDIFSPALFILHNRVNYGLKLLEEHLLWQLCRLFINGEEAAPDRILKCHNAIHFVHHCHETTVPHSPINILYESDDVLVVNKPSGIPVQSSGLRYHYNTVSNILRWEHGYSDLFYFSVFISVIHRLDLMTSGVLIYAKSRCAAAKMNKDIHSNREGSVKEYLCLVEGEFPSCVIVCDKALAPLSSRSSVMIVSPKGKLSQTVFERVSTNGKTSLVKCFLLTGRKHQIRVHSQYLGHPLVNDYIYNSTAFGPLKGRHGEYGQSIESLERSLAKAMTPEDLCGKLTKISSIDQSLLNCENRVDYDPFCFTCHCEAEAPFRFKKSEHTDFYLHCLRYKGPTWEFSAPVPLWAEIGPQRFF